MSAGDPGYNGDPTVADQAAALLIEVRDLIETLRRLRAGLLIPDLDPGFQLLHRVGVRLDAAMIALRQIVDLLDPPEGEPRP